MSLLLNYATFIHDPTFYRHGNHINFANFLSAFYSLHAYTAIELPSKRISFMSECGHRKRISVNYSDLIFQLFCIHSLQALAVK